VCSRYVSSAQYVKRVDRSKFAEVCMSSFCRELGSVIVALQIRYCYSHSVELRLRALAARISETGDLAHKCACFLVASNLM
jgi:hypothetical protein